MAAFSPSSRSTKTLVLAPIFVLCAVFTVVAAIVVVGHNSEAIELAPLMFGGLAIFAFTAAMLVRTTVNRIAAMERESRGDSLTGLPNRRAFHADVAKAEANPEIDEIALAIVDLDGFKAVNDRYGHHVGDAAICHCADILRDVSAGEATAYRLVGDEYALMIAGPLAGTLLEGMCRRVIERLSHPIKVEDRPLTLGASIGLTRTRRGEGVSSSELLRRADVAMDASKRGGKMRCTWFTNAFDKSREQLRQLEDDIRHALTANEFHLHYQPLVDTQTQQVASVEALLRWIRPDGKQVGPDTFIPVAEESGLINAIGLWVLRRACRDALNWDGIMLSVNISAAQLRNPEFPVQLGHILEETGFAPERLELEITETSLVLDPMVAERCLQVIRGFGVRIALDDFGTGYASIGFLRQFRFERLKLDRSLVRQAGEDDGSRAMMVSSITVARAMAMSVTAEGVETTQQADMVRDAGCDQIQGWLYFKAMPAADIAQHLGRIIEIDIDDTPAPAARQKVA